MSDLNIQSNDLSKCIGKSINIKLKNNKLLEGVIFGVSLENRLIVLVNEDKNTNVLTSFYINIDQIEKINLLSKDLNVDTNNLLIINKEHIKNKKQYNYEKDMLIKKAETEPNFKRGLKIFEGLSKYFTCSYDGKKIILKEIDSYIEVPFYFNNLYCKNEENRPRLEKLITNVLKAK